MRLAIAGEPHLTYCTNIHPGETWQQVEHNLRTHVVAVRDALGVSPFGVGLRLSARAARGLAEGDALARLREFLVESGLYVFTLNGFPYGPFHGSPVKQRVYEPDWSSPERLRYSNQLADLLAELLPAETSGSISSVPGAFRARAHSGSVRERIALHLWQHALHLDRLWCDRGILIGLALEPEPACMLETTQEAFDFLEAELCQPEWLARMASVTGRTKGACERLLRRHLGVCLDACHAAVEFEDLTQLRGRIERSSVRIFKLQLSNALRLRSIDAEVEARLRAFDEPVYLHQVVESFAGRLRRFDDLPEALASLAGRRALTRELEWRIHYHVPIFRQPKAPLSSTRDQLRELLAMQRVAPLSTHLEVETYTWDVLPPEERGADVVADIAAELRFVSDELGAELGADLGAQGGARLERPATDRGDLLEDVGQDRVADLRRVDRSL